ncbi:unnamed protein product [Sphagnum balticum]
MSDVLFPACPVPDYSNLLAFEAPPPATAYERRLKPSEYQGHAKAEQITMDILRYYKLNCDTLIKDYKLKIAKQITQDSPIINDLAQIMADAIHDEFPVTFQVYWNVCTSCNLFLLCGSDIFGLSPSWSQKFLRAHPFACKCRERYPGKVFFSRNGPYYQRRQVDHAVTHDL